MYISKSFLVVAIIMLSSCASTEPIVRVVTQKVEIPVPVACKALVPIPPEYCFPLLSKDADIFEKSKCLLSDRLKSIGYETELLTTLNSCK